MDDQTRRPWWRLVLGVLLIAYGALMLAVELYGLVLLGPASPLSWGALMTGAAALFIGWRLYRID